MNKEDKYKYIAKTIEQAINNTGLSKKDFAELHNLKPSQITKWISGTHNFTVETLYEIEHILDIKFFDLHEKKQSEDEKLRDALEISTRLLMESGFNVNSNTIIHNKNIIKEFDLNKKTNISLIKHNVIDFLNWMAEEGWNRNGCSGKNGSYTHWYTHHVSGESLDAEELYKLFSLEK